MKLRTVLALFLMAAASAAGAEQLKFDHRLYPPLKQTLDSGDASMIDFNQSNPRYVVDWIVVRGKSTKDWDEAMQIIARTPTKQVRSVREWMDEIRKASEGKCAARFTTLAEDAVSITFRRDAEDCPARLARSGLYRVVAGKGSLFLLAAFTRAPMDDASRGQWLMLLESARVE